MNEFELFQSALDLEDPTARRLWLKSACQHDPEMLSRVEALLASHEGQSQFLNIRWSSRSRTLRMRRPPVRF